MLQTIGNNIETNQYVKYTMNNNNRESLDEYNTKYDFFSKRIPDTMYIFEVTKLCGYGEFVIVYKNTSLSELFKTVSHCFGNPNVNNLFFMNKDKQIKYPIPNSDFFTVRDLITKFQNTAELRDVVKPLYELPAHVVYKIYYDDGHSHGNGCCA